MRRKHFAGIGLFLVVTLGWALLYHPDPHPSDAALIDYFQKHRVDFEMLASKAREDSGVWAIYSNQVMLENNKVWPENTVEGFTKQRWDEYQSLFARLKKYDINGFFREGSVIRITASIGVSEVDEYEHIVITKGYAYSLGEPSPLVESLDDLGFDSRGTFYRRVGEHWYLYHDWGVSKPE